MSSIITELIKLRRSASWGIVLLLPIIMVAVGGGSTWATDGFVDGWHTLWGWLCSPLSYGASSTGAPTGMRS